MNRWFGVPAYLAGTLLIFLLLFPPVAFPACLSEQATAEAEPCGTGPSPKRAYLAFPTAFAGSAASLFGHLFLVLEREGEPILLADAVDFSAQVPDGEDSGFSYFWGGIRGHFSGQVTVQPLHERLQKYSHFERRDIWLYELKLDDFRLQYLDWHVQEVQGVDFPYRFFSDNCGYRTLAMLDAALGSELHRQLGMTTAPADILRALDDAGLIGKVSQIPSLDTRMDQAWQALPREQRGVVRTYLQNQGIPSEEWLLAHPEAAALLYQYHLDQHRRVSPRYAKLLGLQGHQAASPIIDEPEESYLDPRFQQPYQRLSAAARGGGQQDYLMLAFSPGYHGLLDRPAGYQPGYALRMLEVEVAMASGSGARLSRLTPLSIRSFNAFTRLSPRSSFGLDIDWHERLEGEAQGRRFGRMEAFVGPAFQRQGVTLAASLFSTVEVSGRGAADSRLLLGPRLDALVQRREFAVALSTGLARDAFKQTPDHRYYQLGLSWYPTSRWGLKAEHRRETGRFPEQYHSLGLSWHF